MGRETGEIPERSTAAQTDGNKEESGAKCDISGERIGHREPHLIFEGLEKALLFQ